MRESELCEETLQATDSDCAMTPSLSGEQHDGGCSVYTKEGRAYKGAKAALNTATAPFALESDGETAAESKGEIAANLSLVH